MKIVKDHCEKAYNYSKAGNHLKALKHLGKARRKTSDERKLKLVISLVFQMRVNNLLQEGRRNEAILCNNEHLLWDENDRVALLRQRNFRNGII